MNDIHQQALEIFSPNYIERVNRVKTEQLQFVQYTSAEAAMSMIQNQEIWLRNTQCMNDFNEVEHGLRCLNDAIRDHEVGKNFQALFDELFPGVRKTFFESFESWIPHFKTSTFITCVSEHPQDEDKYGRLSMWRAYGGKSSVALVLNSTPFFAETDVFYAYSYPVAYLDKDDFNQEFTKLTERMHDAKSFLKELGSDVVSNYLFQTFQSAVFSVKHPGFKEEREWRVVYNPSYRRSEKMSMEIRSISGVPQEIQKLPLKDFPDDGFTGATIPQFLKQIIIGPNDQQIVLGKAFAQLLSRAGVDDPWSRISYSGIPLRD